MTSPDEDTLWIANGLSGYHALRPGADDFQATLLQTGDVELPDYLPRRSAALWGGEFYNIGNPCAFDLMRGSWRFVAISPLTPGRSAVWCRARPGRCRI